MLHRIQNALCVKYNCIPFWKKKSQYNEPLDKEMIIIQWKDTEAFLPKITQGVVIKVYDGDTITIASTLPKSTDKTLYRFSVRLNGIDTPEMKGSSEKEKELAKKAQVALSELLLHKNVRLEHLSNEKYGRLLADIYIDNIHVNQWMIKENYAVLYSGGKKEHKWV
tara:strand:+ start:10074 stop:10571 length:498 start_codon:yes stop_codon:yes gene_type:complete